jgi:MerR family transcriptional regulator/heat shock protein HspR
MGLVQPGRTSGGGRRYSERDVALLREVQRLSQEEGVNLAGIKRIIELEGFVSDLRQRVADLEDELIRTRTRLAHLEATGFPRRDLVPTHQRQTALVVWRPSQK